MEDMKLLPSKEPDEKRFCGLSRTFYIGGYISSITNFIVNSFMLSLITAWPFALIIDVIFIFPVFCISWIGLCKTAPDIPEEKGAWNTPRVAVCAAVFYMGIFITFFAYLLTLPGDVQCPIMRPDTVPEWSYLQHCAWYQYKNIFYVHAFTGPAVLALECFNFMKTSRGLLFPIALHRYIGRINNILVVICSIGAFGTAMIASSEAKITSGFFILLAYWLPTMLLGWYFVVAKNIKQHTRFMTRHFTGTCGAITLRLLSLFGAPYIICVWGSLPQLFLIELYLQQQDDCDRVFLSQLLKSEIPTWWGRVNAVRLSEDDCSEIENVRSPGHA